MRLVVVHWKDTVGHPDNDVWMSLDEALEMKPISMLTAGYLLTENDDFVVVASTKSLNTDEDCVGNVNAIPRSCIMTITDLCEQGHCDSDSFAEKI